MATDLDDLIAAVLDARDRIHPEIEDAFLISVVNAVQEAGNDADAARRAVEAAVNEALAEGGEAVGSAGEVGD